MDDVDTAWEDRGRKISQQEGGTREIAQSKQQREKKLKRKILSDQWEQQQQQNDLTFMSLESQKEGEKRQGWKFMKKNITKFGKRYKRTESRD